MAVNIVSTLRNPSPEFDLRSQGKAFPTEGFTDQEAGLLEEEVNQLILEQESSVLGSVVEQRSSAIAQTAAFSKQVFDEKLFGGINAGDNEIGFSVLRPGQIRADPANGDSQNDWYFNPNGTGWNDWIGDGTSGNNFTFPEDQVTIVLGLTDQDVNSEISAMNVDAFGRNVDMLPIDTNDMRLQDNDTEQMFIPTPTLVGQENDQVHIRLRHDRDVESQPRLVGFSFGLGSHLNTEDFS